MSMKPSIDELKSDLREFHGYIMKSQEFIESVQKNDMEISKQAIRLSEHEKLMAKSDKNIEELQTKTTTMIQVAETMKTEITKNEEQISHVEVSLNEAISRHDAHEKKNGSEFRTMNSRLDAMEEKNAKELNALKAEMEAKHSEQLALIKNETEALQKKISRNMTIQSVLLALVAAALAVAIYLA